MSVASGNAPRTSDTISRALRGQRTFAIFAWAVLAYNLPVILWGAYVRVSFSGDGCGANWPFC
jgi:heme A synthase